MKGKLGEKKGKLIYTLVTPKRAYKKVMSKVAINGEIQNVMVKVRGAIDVHSGLVNSHNYDVYSNSCIMSYKRAIEFLTLSVNRTKNESWFLFDTWRCKIWKVTFKLLNVETELVATRDKKKQEWEIKVDKNGSEERYVRDFIIDNEKTKVNKLRKLK